jgi:hypothetical protein
MRKVGIIPLVILSTALAPGGLLYAVEVKKSEDAFVPYHQHRDTRFGHDHAYPDRGSVVRDVPKTASVVNFAGVQYRFHEGVWYEPRGPAFIVVAPPIGVLVPTLPPFSTLLAQRGNVVLYGNDTFYQPRPDLGGYEVVNDPSDPAADPREAASAAAPAAAAPAGAAPSASPAAALGAAPAVLAAAAVPSATATPLALPETATATAAPLPAHDALPAHDTLQAHDVVPVHDVLPAPAAVPAIDSSITVASLAKPGDGSRDSNAARANRAFIYPKNGQSADQQARDRYECYRFGVSQTGFDPMRPAASVDGAKAGAQSEFERAQGVCLDARGYAVR